MKTKIQTLLPLLFSGLFASGCGEKLDYPEPGSGAADYCDSNSTGPGYVRLPNGV